MSGFIDQAPQTTPANFYVAPQPQPSNPGAQGLSDYTQALIAKQPQQMTFQQQLEAGQQIAKNNIDIKNAQMTQQANIAIGQAIQNATDPNTGEVDYQQALAHAAMNPQATFGMNDFVSTAIANGKVTADTVKTTLDNQLTKLGAVSDGIASLTSDPDLGKADTTDTFKSEIGPLVQSGMIPADEAATELQAYQNMTPAQQHAFVLQRSQMFQQAGATLSQNLGTITAQSTGGGTAFPAEGQLGGAPTIPAPLANTQSADQANGLVQVQNADGSTSYIRQADVASGTTATMAPQDKQVLETLQPQINQAATDALAANQSLQEMDSLETGFAGGGGASFRESASRAAQALGMPQSVVDGIAGGNQADMQQFMKVQRLGAFNAVKAALGGSGQVTQNEISDIQNVWMDPNTSLQARMGISKWMQSVNQMAVEKQKRFQTYIQAGGPPSGFSSYWNQFMQKTGMVKAVAPPDFLKSGNSNDDDTSPPPGIAP